METNSFLGNLKIKIVRRGEKMKFTIGKYSLEVKEMPGYSQSYPLILIEEFLSTCVTKLVKDELNRQNLLEAIKEEKKV